MRAFAAILVAILATLPLTAATTIEHDAGPASAWLAVSTSTDGEPGTPGVETSAGAEADDRAHTEMSYSTDDGTGDGGGNDPGGGTTREPDPPASDPNSLVDKIEPGNNNCSTPEVWPLSGNIGTSSGVFNSSDTADWSSLGVLRTETLQGSAVGAAVLAYAGCSAIGAVEVEAEADADYLLRASPTATVLYGVPVKYQIDYKILPNDASQHRDLGTDAGTAHRIEVFVNGPQTPFFGGLPNRGFQGDEDGYLIDIPVPLTVQSGSAVIPAALVTVHFRATCSLDDMNLRGVGALQLFDLNGNKLLLPEESCGALIHQSCVALGHTTVLAKAFIPDPATVSVRGTSYDISATASPIGILWTDTNNLGPYATYAAEMAAAGRLDDARDGSSSVVDVSTFNAQAPWCSPTAPMLLSTLADAWRAVGNVPLPNDLFEGDPGGDLPQLPARIGAYVRTFLP